MLSRFWRFGRPPGFLLSLGFANDEVNHRAILRICLVGAVANSGELGAEKTQSAIASIALPHFGAAH